MWKSILTSAGWAALVAITVLVASLTDPGRPAAGGKTIRRLPASPTVQGGSASLSAEMPGARSGDENLNSRVSGRSLRKAIKKAAAARTDPGLGENLVQLVAPAQ
jgi:hypothetical protein